MRLNAAGQQLIKDSEGVRLQAYLDIAGIPTIGTGNIYITVNGVTRRVKLGDTITQAEADEMFIEAVNERESQLESILGRTVVADNQWAALMDFLWNFGIGNMSSSTLIKLIHQNPKDSILPPFIDITKSFIARAKTTHQIEDIAVFINAWNVEMQGCPKGSIAYQFLQWTHSEGKVSFGLLVRRMKEVVLYNS